MFSISKLILLLPIIIIIFLLVLYSSSLADASPPAPSIVVDDKFAYLVAVILTLHDYNQTSDINRKKAIIYIEECYQETMQLFRVGATPYDEIAGMIDEYDNELFTEIRSIKYSLKKIFRLPSMLSLSEAVSICGSSSIKFAKTTKYRYRIEQFFKQEFAPTHARLAVRAIDRFMMHEISDIVPKRVSASDGSDDIDREDESSQKQKYFLRILLQCIFSDTSIRKKMDTENSQNAWATLTDYLNTVMLLDDDDDEKKRKKLKKAKKLPQQQIYANKSKPFTVRKLEQYFDRWYYYITNEISINFWRNLPLPAVRSSTDLSSSPWWINMAIIAENGKFNQNNKNYANAISLFANDIRDELAENVAQVKYRSNPGHDYHLHHYYCYDDCIESEYCAAKQALLFAILPRFRAKYSAHNTVSSLIENQRKHYVKELFGKNADQARRRRYLTVIINRWLGSQMSEAAFKFFKEFLIKYHLFPPNFDYDDDDIEDDIDLTDQWTRFIEQSKLNNFPPIIASYYDDIIDQTAAESNVKTAINRLQRSMIDLFGRKQIDWIPDLEEFEQRLLMAFLYSIAEFERYLFRNLPIIAKTKIIKKEKIMEKEIDKNESDFDDRFQLSPTNQASLSLKNSKNFYPGLELADIKEKINKVKLKPLFPDRTKMSPNELPKIEIHQQQQHEITSTEAFDIEQFYNTNRYLILTLGSTLTTLLAVFAFGIGFMQKNITLDNHNRNKVLEKLWNKMRKRTTEMPKTTTADATKQTIAVKIFCGTMIVASILAVIGTVWWYRSIADSNRPKSKWAQPKLSQTKTTTPNQGVKSKNAKNKKRQLPTKIARKGSVASNQK